MALSKIDVANMVENEMPQANIDNNINFRNIIINGGMDIAQRQTSQASAGNAAGNYQTIDRFAFANQNMGTFTISQDTDVPSSQGFTKSLKLDCTTADASPATNDYLILFQRFEGQMLQYLKKGTSSAQSLTLSFWVKSNKTGTYIAELRDNDNSRAISKTYTINSASTWEKKTLTFAGDTTGALDNDSNSSLNVNWWLGAGTNFTSGTLATSWASITNANRVVGQTVNLADSTSNEWYITGVQLEAGQTASEFEFLPQDVTLARCQRYYEKSNNLSLFPGDTNADGYYLSNFTRNASNQNYFPVYYKQNKRAEATVTIYSYATGASSKYRNVTDATDYDANVARSGDTSFVFHPSGFNGVDLGDVMGFHWTADAEI